MPASIQRNTRCCLINSASMWWRMLSKILLLADGLSGLLNPEDDHDQVLPRCCQGINSAKSVHSSANLARPPYNFHTFASLKSTTVFTMAVLLFALTAICP